MLKERMLSNLGIIESLESRNNFIMEIFLKDSKLETILDMTWNIDWNLQIGSFKKSVNVQVLNQ